MKNLIPPILCAFVISLAGCGDAPEDESGVGRSGEKTVIYAVNYPLAYFAERIGGDAIELKFPAPAGEDPAFWNPSDAEIAGFQQADLILRNGAAYAKWTETASLPKGSQVDTSKAFADRLIVAEADGSHSHGSAGEYAHGGTAFTTWIDFEQAIVQAEAVRDAIKSVVEDPGVEARFESLKSELGRMDLRMEMVGERIGDEPLLGSHPVYQYFGRRYGLNVKSVHWEPEVVPDANTMLELKKLLAGHPAKWMIWEGEPAAESVAKLEALGVRSLVFDPCGNRPDEGDFLSVMEANLARAEAAFSDSK